MHKNIRFFQNFLILVLIMGQNFLILFAFCLLCVSCSETQRQHRDQFQNVDSLSISAQKSDTLIFIHRTFADTSATPNYIIEAQFPELVHYEREGIRKQFNAEIKNILDGSISSFKIFLGGQSPETGYKNDSVPLFSKLSIDYDLAYNSRLVSSIIFHFEQLDLPSDNILRFNKVLNFNLLNGETIFIEDLLQADTTLLKRLSDLTFNKLSTQMPDADTTWIRNGTEPVLENFKNFLFMLDSGSVIFNIFQVAPAEVGTIRLNFAWKELFPDSLGINPLNVKPK